MTRQSSLDAYATLNIQKREKTILRCVLKRKDMTRNEISRATGLPINVVSGRVTRMIELNMLEELGRRKCRITGNNNHAVRA